MKEKTNYKDRMCEICGCLYKPTNSKQKYCINCKKIAKYKYDKEWRKNNKDIIKRYDKEYYKKYYEQHSEKIKQKSNIYYQNNKEKKKEYQKEYSKKNKQIIKEKRKIYYENNKEKINKQKRDIYKKNIDYYREYDKTRNKTPKRKEQQRKSSKKYRENNIDKIKQNAKIYRQTDEYKNNRRQYRLKKYYNDICYKLSEWSRTQIYRCLNSNKTKHTFDILGYTPEQLKQRLEMNFKPDMTWENHGTLWHIDHRKPLCKFNLTLPDGTPNYEQIRLANSLANLQPLYVTENLSKGGR